MTKIVIDALGSDLGYPMVIEALKIAMKDNKDFKVCLVGPKKQMSESLNEFSNRIEFIEASETIDNNESPVNAIRKKKEASMVKAFNCLNEEDCMALLSAGSTGGMLAGASLITKRIRGIKRCCLAGIMPQMDGSSVIIADCGANMDTTPTMLYQFAILASAYASYVLGEKSPKIALLSVGSEDHKGDKRTLEAHEMLKNSKLNFIGNVEARDILNLNCQVLITDGFAGNIAIKTLEGTAKSLLNLLKGTMYASTKGKIAGFLLKSSLNEAFKPMDYKNHGGAPLMGARKAIYKAHGNSSAETFALAIKECLVYAESGIEDKVKEYINEMGEEND